MVYLRVWGSDPTITLPLESPPPPPGTLERILQCRKKAKIPAKGKAKDVAVQRDILGLVMASKHEGAVVGLDKALSHVCSLTCPSCFGNK